MLAAGSIAGSIAGSAVSCFHHLFFPNGEEVSLVYILLRSFSRELIASLLTSQRERTRFSVFQQSIEEAPRCTAHNPANERHPAACRNFVISRGPLIRYTRAFHIDAAACCRCCRSQLPVCTRSCKNSETSLVTSGTSGRQRAPRCSRRS